MHFLLPLFPAFLYGRSHLVLARADGESFTAAENPVRIYFSTIELVMYRNGPHTV